MAWESICFKKCASLFDWKVNYFCCCCSINKGVWFIAGHTFLNGIILLAVLFDSSEELTTSSFGRIFFPDDAKLMFGVLGSPLMILAIKLVVGSVTKNPWLLRNFVIGIKIMLVIFPIVFAGAYIRTYLTTAADLAKSRKLFISEKSFWYSEFYTTVVLYFIAAYTLINYIFYFYYIIVVSSFKKIIEINITDKSKSLVDQEKVVKIIHESDSGTYLEPQANGQLYD